MPSGGGGEDNARDLDYSACVDLSLTMQGGFYHRRIQNFALLKTSGARKVLLCIIHT